ncbi:hypothetical protein G7046_g3777 [Stylonectria norvegica]|nr:hypothetical protein G7046_g3777 [Stylonectria norvegica]
MDDFSSIGSSNSMSNQSGNTKLPKTRWGAACGPCAETKAKCIRTNLNPDSKCDRCQKLLKDCSDQVRRPRKKRLVKPSRTAEIEERLNGLVNLLTVPGDVSGAESPTNPESLPAETEARTSQQTIPSTAPGNSSEPAQNPWAVPEIYNSYAPPLCICRAQSGDPPPPPDTDDALLNFYRTQLQRLHPFVIIPSTISAASLKSTRPFLMSAIRMVASVRSLTSMRAQMYHLMKHIADHMLVRSEKSLDMLLGIIVIVGWYQYHCFVHAQLNTLLHLAATLVEELGLRHQPLPRGGNVFISKRSVAPPARTNEERRALVGVWFMTSCMSINLQKMASYPYTDYAQECLNDLESDLEHPSDLSLVSLVRIQHLVERIHQMKYKVNILGEMSPLSSVQTAEHVASFQSELDHLRDSLPMQLKTDKIFMTYLHSATLRLYEPPIIDNEQINSISSSFASNTSDGGNTLKQLYLTRNALVAWFDNWLAVPVSAYYCQTTEFAAQLIYSIAMLGRWARLETPRTMFAVDGSASPGQSAGTRSGKDGLETGSSPEAVAASRIIAGEVEEPCLFGQIPQPKVSNTKLATAVAELQVHLRQQAGLSINIPQILTLICSRFEEASATFPVSSTHVGSVDTHNPWTMSALKIRLTREKLERWSDLVFQETQALKTQSGNDNDSTMSDWAMNITTMNSVQYEEPSLQQDQTQLQSLSGTRPYTNDDVLQGIDPAIWFDEYLDWSYEF